jgi:DNA processing protein
VVISEFHPDMHVAPNNLIFRNRLITGLSRATVVIECGLESGAMSAARRAYMQGRPVFVRGGSAGTELLLTEGAKLLPERVEDLDQELRSMPLQGQ